MPFTPDSVEVVADGSVVEGTNVLVTNLAAGDEVLSFPDDLV